MPQKELSFDTKVIISILLLIFMFPIGLILVFYWKLFSHPLILGLAISILVLFTIVSLSVIQKTDPQENQRVKDEIERIKSER